MRWFSAACLSPEEEDIKSSISGHTILTGHSVFPRRRCISLYILTALYRQSLSAGQDTQFVWDAALEGLRRRVNCERWPVDVIVEG